MKSFTAKFLIASCLAMMLGLWSGCVSMKDNVVYFNNADEVLIDQTLPDYDMKIKPGDELRILVSSAIPEATVMYGLQPYMQVSANAQQASSSTRLSTYIVSQKGYVTMPVLGDIMVQGKTTEEVKQLVYERVAKEVKDPVVSVEFVQYYITVIGEVSSPKRFSVTQQRFSVLDALGSCGGVKLTGVRDRVRLLREEEGRVVNKVLDLGDANLINSPYYYMQQNDVLIVDANDAAKTNAHYNQMNGFRLQVVSTCASTLSIIVSLFIALTK